MYDCQTDAATEFSFAPETPVRPATSPAPRSTLRGRFYCLPRPGHQTADLAALQALMLNARLGERFVTHCELRLARPVRMA